jgi:hypothetical protein
MLQEAVELSTKLTKNEDALPPIPRKVTENAAVVLPICSCIWQTIPSAMITLLLILPQKAVSDDDKTSTDFQDGELR